VSGCRQLAAKGLDGDQGDVGDVKSTISTTAPAGWLMLNGDTIGSAASAATLTSEHYEELFAVL
jgi:hypothetical protein